ncbi:MAG: ribonuclease III [Patescibacteria group bacterium]
MNRNLDSIQKKIGVSFKDVNILRNALVHRSYINEHKDFPVNHNERLEFLGDAVLELVVTDHLYHNYDEAEGVLTNWRSGLVNATQLAAQAEVLGVYDFLYLSRGESQDTNKKARGYILANALEALIGAIYLDQGYRVAAKFIKDNIIIHLDNLIKDKSYLDAKSLFQEKSQEMVGITPRYKVLSESGPDHHKKFVVGVYLDKELIAEGTGYSKQEAQTEAAAAALEAKSWL